jgi:hypothetical protein
VSPGLDVTRSGITDFSLNIWRSVDGFIYWCRLSADLCEFYTAEVCNVLAAPALEIQDGDWRYPHLPALRGATVGAELLDYCLVAGLRYYFFYIIPRSPIFFALLL